MDTAKQPRLIPPRAATPADDASGGMRPPLRAQRDPAPEPGHPSFREMNLWIHQDVLDQRPRWDHLQRSTAAVLHRLAAHGRTSVVKGCSGANKGWRRSPLGGNGGMQFYLWWTVQGNQQAAGIAGTNPGDIIVRAIRHHDDHDPLSAGDSDDYTHGERPQFIDDYIGTPWTAGQLDFVNHEHPVRLLQGQPGSGKTTALWKAIEAHAGQRVLYLTWSRQLTRYAEEHLATFAPQDVEVKPHDFLTYLGELLGTDVERQTLDASRARFKAAVRKSRLGPRQLGPWRGREDALFAEVRAVLLGAAFPDDETTVLQENLVRLSDRDYRDHRKELGDGAVKAIPRVAKALGSELASAFPELAAASTAIERLRDDAVPDALSNFDRIVVDEAQDLTPLETLLVAEHAHMIARKRGRAPWLLLAGDEGQTVRPSGFKWGPVSNIVARIVGEPRSFVLEGNQRCPTRIADVIDRASDRYRALHKAGRPEGQQREAGGRDVDAQLIHVVVPDHQDARDLLRRLRDQEDVAIVTPDLQAPSWTGDDLRDVVLSPAGAKGLEYQAVCILDPGCFLARLDEASRSVGKGGDKWIEEHEQCTAIDRLRVALSRATETLAFVDVEGDRAAHSLSVELLGDAVPYKPADLVEHLTRTDATPDERVLMRIEEARSVIDDRPDYAWLRAEQAIKLLGDATLPNGVADRDLREQARTTLLATAARLLIDQLPDGLTRQDVVATGKQAIDEGSATGTEAKRLSAIQVALDELSAWSGSDRDATPPFGLLNAVLALNDPRWLRDALPPVRQTLRTAITRHAETPDEAARFAGDVEGWLALTGFAGDAAAQARQLRIRAGATLIGRDNDAAERVLAKVMPEETPLVARLREAQRRFDEAAEAYERAEMPDDARRAWRQACRWERAARFADGAERQHLHWLMQLERIVARRPERIDAELADSERQRLDLLAKAITQVDVAKTVKPTIPAPTPEPDRKPPSTKPPPGRGKYTPLYRHLNALSSDQWRTTFADVESLIGAQLPKSARRHPAWWSNSSSHQQAKAWLDAGFRTCDVDVTSQSVTFQRKQDRLF